MQIFKTGERVEQGETLDVNRTATLIALCALASVTPSAVLLGPLIVGGLVTELGFGAQAAGNMIFAELSGAACATFPALYWISRSNWRTVLYISLATMTLCNLASVIVTSPWLFGGIRFIAGLGVGSVMAITLLTCGMTRQQERTLSFWMTGQIVFAAVMLAAMPYIFAVVGIGGLYGCLVAATTLLLLVVPFMPRTGGLAVHQRWGDLPSVTRRSAPLALIGLLFFFIAMGGVWNFVERLGDAAGYGRKFIGLTLAGVSAVGVCGSISAAWLGLRWGRLAPFLCGIAILIVSMLLLRDLASPLQFVLAAFLFKFGWWFVSPFILANITTLDRSGKLITATNFVIAAGQAMGPLVVGFMLSPARSEYPDTVNFASAINIGLACLILCCALFISIIRINDSSARRA